MDNSQLISAISIIAPLLVGAIFIRTLLLTCKVLFVLIIIVAIIELLAIILAKNGINNLFLFHIYSFIEFGLISLIYYQLTHNKRQRQFIFYFLILFQGFSLINLYFEDALGFNSFQRHIEATILMFYFFFYLFEITKSRYAQFTLANPFVILTTGYIIYFVGTLYLFIYGNEIIKGTDNSFWLIHSVLNIFLNGIYAIVLWKGRVRMKE